MSDTPNEEGIVIEEVEAGNDVGGEVDVSGMLPEEQAGIEKFGLNKKPEVKKEENADIKQPEVKPEDKPADKKEEVENPTFEQAEADEKLVDKFGKNEKALYWKWKTDKHKRQEAQKEVDALKEQLKVAVEGGASNKKVEKIKELLKNPDSLTVEALQAAIDEQVAEDKKPNDLDNAEVIRNKVATKSMFAEKIGNAKYEKFNDIANLAKDVIKEDASGTYQKLIDESFLNDGVDENMLVERIVNIARMSPKYSSVVNAVAPEAKEKANRVLENSNKKVSSASLNGASGKRIVSEAELTAEQAARLSPEQWRKLKPETKKRLMAG
jgi:hypothetical protein